MTRIWGMKHLVGKSHVLRVQCHMALSDSRIPPTRWLWSSYLSNLKLAWKWAYPIFRHIHLSFLLIVFVISYVYSIDYVIMSHCIPIISHIYIYIYTYKNTRKRIGCWTSVPPEAQVELILRPALPSSFRPGRPAWLWPGGLILGMYIYIYMFIFLGCYTYTIYMFMYNIYIYMYIYYIINLYQ